MLANEYVLGGHVKGHVRAELYDCNTGEVLEVRENHNVVTAAAGTILAKLVANPTKESRFRNSVTLDTSTVPDDAGYYRLKVPNARYARRSVDLVPNGQTATANKPIAKLVKVFDVDPSTNTKTRLVIGKDVYLADEDTGRIYLSTPLAAGHTLAVEYLEVVNPMVRILEGTEEVYVGTTKFSRSTATNADGDYVPSDASLTYVIDYDTGELIFETPKVGVKVDYDFKTVAAVAFMGISDRPAGYPAGVPIVFGDADKSKVALDAEYPNCRQLVSLPAQVTVGSEKTETKGTNGTVYYVLSSTPVIELLRVTHSNGTVYTVVSSPTTTPNCVWLHDASTGEVRFSSAPPAGTLTFVYRWNSGTTVSFVADFPRGVPGGTVETNTETFTGIAGAGTQYVLRYPVKENTTPTVRVDDVQLSAGQYSLSEDRQVLTITYTLVGGETIVVEYQYDKTFADIYEVGLFNDRTGGDMFAISGIGPITKDINTGMRVTWNITFLRG